VKLIGLPCPRCSALINKQVKSEKHHICEKCGCKIKIADHEHSAFDNPDVGPRKPEIFKVYNTGGGFSVYDDPDEDYSYNPY